MPRKRSPHSLKHSVTMASANVGLPPFSVTQLRIRNGPFAIAVGMALLGDGKQSIACLKPSDAVAYG